MISAAELRTVATSECVVPRSMPIARRRWCGSGDSPGSEICSSAMSAGGGCRLGSAAHASARGAPVDLVAARLPLAPAGVRKLHVVLVVALRGERVDDGPVQGVGALELPSFD